MAKAKKLAITQIKSGIGYPVRTKQTLKALGIRRMHDTVVLEDSEAVRGMIDKVCFLVEVKPAAEENK
ncbi:MAG: 50S ribosomal protein L30 [Anaerolineaceae bacterium]|nr:50S ribosomal protein L30 [Anaerolineaceae bacterium]